MDGSEPRKTRVDQRRGPKPAAATVPSDTPAPAAQRVEGLMDGGFSLDHSDKHLRNYHRLNPDSHDDDLYFRMTRALVVAARRWRKVANDRLKPLEQTMVNWEALYLVAYSGEELNQSQLSRVLGVHGPTMLRMLDALARQDLIERQQSSEDRRVTINRITPKGRAVITRIMRMTNELRREVLEGINPRDLATTVRVLVQMLAALEGLDQPGPNGKGQ